MDKIIEILELDKIPSGTPQQRKTGIYKGRAITYPADSLIEARVIYRQALAKCKRPSQPLTGPLRLILAFEYGTKDTHKAEEWYKITKPDVDNMAKMFTDQLKVFRYFNDDNQICDLYVRKRWTLGKSRLIFILEPLEDKKWMLKSIFRKSRR